MTERVHISGTIRQPVNDLFKNHIQIKYEYNKGFLARLKNMHTDKQDALLECLKDSNFWRFREREDRIGMLKQLTASGREKSG